MREFNALSSYPSPRAPRLADRTIYNKITASYRDREFFDGDRRDGYGGLVNDGRWAVIAKDMASEYGLTQSSQVLQIGCEKGFLLDEFRKLGMGVVGIETSGYALNHIISDIPCGVDYDRIACRDKYFDLVIAIGAVYTLNLAGAIRCLKEIVRVGRRAFITLAAYETMDDLKLMMRWSLLGCTILRKKEWIAVLEHVGYRGDYSFVTAKSLGLVA